MAKKRGTKEENLISPNENVCVRQQTSGGERKLERALTNLLTPGDFGKLCRVKKYTTERGMYLAIGNSSADLLLSAFKQIFLSGRGISCRPKHNFTQKSRIHQIIKGLL
jgi:hypothetical protein